MTIATFGEEAGREWLTQMLQLCPRMARVFITTEWVAILDFETRFPSALEKAMKQGAGT